MVATKPTVKRRSAAASSSSSSSKASRRPSFLRNTDFLCEALLVGVSLGHVLLSPYTKVEESFSLHAVWDILSRGVSEDAIAQYDHKTFTGPLPRSFVGAVTVATATWPTLFVTEHLFRLHTPLLKQIIIRATLALSNAACLIFLARRLRDVFHSRVSRQFLILTSVQFHIPFWLGRTVPNMFAFGPAQIALACILLPKQRTTRRWSRPDVLLGLSILTILAIILRLELVGLLIPLAIQAWWFDRVDWLEGGFTILASGLAALSVTLSVDSHFWQDSVWPELHNLFFNVVDGRSGDWGTSPWHTYAFISLPKLMLLSYPFFLIGIAVNPIARRLCFPLAFYVGLMSCLGHKEWRFISYTVPTFNILSLASIVRIRQYNRRLSKIIFRCICISSLLVTILSTGVSMLNYPGGYALSALHSHLRSQRALINATTAQQQPLPLVHLDSYTCMTGTSNVLHRHDLARYDKDETLETPAQYEKNSYDYLVTHEPQLHAEGFEAVRGIRGWAGVRPQLGPLKAAVSKRSIAPLLMGKGEGLAQWIGRVVPLRPQIEEQIWIMRNRRHRP